MRYLLLNRLWAVNCRASNMFSPARNVRALTQLVGNWDSGAMKGNAGSGTIRESGGSLGEREHAMEEIYFRNLTGYQLDNLREHHLDEIKHLEKELKTSEESIKRHKMRLDNLKKIASQMQ
jgi:hypothetical protein